MSLDRTQFPKYFETVDNISIVNDFVFMKQTQEDKYLLCAYLGKKSHVVLPSKAPGNKDYIIASNAFYNQPSITSVEIPQSTFITEIQACAFRDCENLKRLVIKAKDIKINAGIIADCAVLETLEVPYINKQSLQTFLNYLFSMNESTSSNIDVPSTLKNICITGSDLSFMNTFKGCTSLNEIQLTGDDLHIGTGVFNGCTALTKLSIANTSSWGTDAFTACPLEEVTAPVGAFSVMTRTTLKKIKLSAPSGFSSFDITEQAFKECANLEEVIIDDGCNAINAGAFQNCTSLMSVIIPDGITSIGLFAFSNCSSLTGVTIPDSVTSIGNSAFRDCTSLTSITIPNSIISISPSVFGGCTSLESISLPFVGATKDETSDTHFGYIFGAWDYSVNSTHVPPSLRNVVITGSNSIAASAFEGCSSLTSITIPNSVTSIGSSAFRNCTSLTSITIPNSVTSIGYDAFDGCESLTSVTIPDSVTSIGEYAFSCCTSLTSITIPNSVTSIGEYAFWDCESLTSIIIPDSVTSIGDQAFRFCYSLTSITIPDSVTSIGSWAFSDCTNLLSITLKENLNLTSIAEDNTIFNDCYKLVEIINYTKTDLTTNSYGGIAEYAKIIHAEEQSVLHNKDGFIFYCEDTTEDKIAYLLGYVGTDDEIELPDRFTDTQSGKYEVYKYAFAWSTLKEITITEARSGLDKIQPYAFYYCDQLENLIIHPQNTGFTLGHSILCGCSNLKRLSLPFVGQKACPGANSQYPLGYLFGDAEYIDSYLASQRDPEVGDKGYYLPKSLTHIKLLGYNTEDPTSKVGYIPAGAFSNCANLKNVDFENYNNYSFIDLESMAFSNCTNLIEIFLPLEFNIISSYVFSGCNKLVIYCKASEKPVLWESEWNQLDSDGVTGCCPTFWSCMYFNQNPTLRWVKTRVDNLEKIIIRGCTNRSLGKLDIPVTLENRVVEAIAPYAFADCEKLTQVIFNYSASWELKTIGKSAFRNCTKLEQIVLPHSLEKVEPNAFFGCENLKVVRIPEVAYWFNIDFESPTANPLYYAKRLVQYNGEVTDLTVPREVVELKKYVFYNCESLKSVELSTEITKIDTCAFYNCPNLTKVIFNKLLEKTHALKTIEAQAFKNCSRLRYIELPESLTNINGEGEEAAFFNCVRLVEIRNKSTLELICGDTNNNGQIASKAKVVYQGDYVSLPSRVGTTGAGLVFYTEDSNRFLIDYVGDRANLIIENTLSSITNFKIADHAFFDNSVIKNISILGSTNITIGNSAFASCSNLSQVTIASPTSIGDHVFANCDSLETCIFRVLPDDIGEYSFAGSQIKSIQVSANTFDVGQNFLAGLKSWGESSKVLLSVEVKNE